MSITNFYLLPVEQVAHFRGPKYLKCRHSPGLPHQWSLKDFGNDSPIGLIATEATITKPDVLPLDEWSVKQRDRLAAYLKDGGIESDWLLKAADYRDALQRITGLTQAYQSGSDTPHLWLGREVFFGFAKLRPLDRQTFEAERLARAQEQIEYLRVRWSAQRPAFDWCSLLKIFALNPLSILTAALPATDVFTSTNGTALTTYSSNWTNNDGAFVINTNAVAPNSAGQCCAYWNADTFNNNQYSQATVTAIDSWVYIGVGVRIAASAGTYYGYYSDSADASYLFKAVSGTFTLLGSFDTVFTTSLAIRIEANDTSIRPMRGGSTASIGTQTDSSISSGSAGIVGADAGTTSRIDNWEGGNITTPGKAINRFYRKVRFYRKGF